MLDIRRLRSRLVRFFRLFAICKPSERCSIRIDIPVRLLNDGGEAKAVLDYGGEF